MRVLALTSIVAVSLAITAAAPSRPDSLERIAINDNRSSAGQLRDKVLTVRLEIRRGDWRPDRDADPGLEVLAFAEEGRELQIPGPLIRVIEGTEIHASVRNPLAAGTLIVHGFYTRGRGDVLDTMHVAPGTVREVRFTAGTPGTYYYWGSISNTRGIMGRQPEETQLSGAFIVDARAAAARSDRVFVIGFWSDSLLDLVPLTRATVRFVINGKSWPHTERLSYAQGDNVHWRVINTNNQVHPMHLHGFYFRVNSRGNERNDSVYDPRSAPHLAVTERLAPGRTMSMTWVPERPGNWLFHCHDNVHIRPQLPLDDRLPPQSSDHQHKGDPMLEMMAGLVMGVHVRTSSVAAARPEPPARRHLRLVARIDASGSAAEPAYGFVLEEPGRASKSGPALLPGPTILLRRGEPVSITVVNELSEPTAVHWHGIELESYFDGVAGFAGRPGRIAPAIAPRDSFQARFTPPRAGTFIYHTHVDEVRQQRAGLSGPLLVVDDPRSYDAQTDIVLLISTPRGDADREVVLINGSKAPPALELRAGARHRIRIINIHTFRPSMRVEIKQGTQPLTWRALAKDGADLPAERAIVRPANLQFGNGETYDFELTPTIAGEAVLEVRTGAGVLLASLPIRVH